LYVVHVHEGFGSIEQFVDLDRVRRAKGCVVMRNAQVVSLAPPGL
jgi:hypothetical protein